MKKVLALLVVGGAVLAGGQFYSSKMTNEYLQQGSQELARNGMTIDHKDVKKGFFKSKAQDQITFEIEGDEILATLDYDITHLPWGGSFDGTVEVQVTNEEQGTKKIFSEVLDTQALMSGSFNVVSGGNAEFKVNPFDIKEDGLNVIMEKPLLMNVSSNLDATNVKTTGELHKLVFLEEDKKGSGTIEGITFQAHQKGAWPDTDDMDVNAEINIAKADIQSELRDEKFDINDLVLNIDASVDEGLLAYEINTALGSFDTKTAQGEYKGKGKGDFRFEGLYIAPFQDFAKQVLAKMEELTKAGNTKQEDLLGEAVSANMELLKTNLFEASLQKSRLKYSLSNVNIESNVPDFENISGDAELTIDTQAMDFEQLKDAAASRSPFAMMAFLEYIGVKVKAKGLPEDIMLKAGVTGDELDLLLKNGVLTVNGEETPLF